MPDDTTGVMRTLGDASATIGKMYDFISACFSLDPMRVIETGSYVGVSALVFAESGLLFGIFLPGDSLLFAAGLVAAGGYLSPTLLIACVVAAAILGDSVGSR
jgi:membrane protein DedA with SNARE-associated domain